MYGSSPRAGWKPTFPVLAPPSPASDARPGRRECGRRRDCQQLWNIYIYIYIYIKREREREIDR